MRKLASIRLVAEVKPIPNADAIEAVRVDGWWCVTKKGELTVGQRCVYFEIDAFLPEIPIFEFLRKSSWVDADGFRGFRIRTVRLRGQLSQGLAMPLSALNEAMGWGGTLYARPVGDDVTKDLKVILYDPPPPAEMMGIARGYRPGWVKGTELDRIQNVYGDLKATAEHVLFEETVKRDGYACLLAVRDGVLHLFSADIELFTAADGGDPSNPYVAVASRHGGAVLGAGRNLVFQGELVGPGIRKNPLGLAAKEWHIFSVWDIDTGLPLTPEERWGLVARLGLTHVPVLGVWAPLEETLEELLARADRSLDGRPVEGLVFKSVDGAHRFKVISNQYLLKEG